MSKCIVCGKKEVKLYGGFAGTPIYYCKDHDYLWDRLINEIESALSFSNRKRVKRKEWLMNPISMKKR